jgi:anti-anti-sigma factor
VTERPFQAVLMRDQRVLALSGVVDELSLPDLRDALREATDGYTSEVTVDLSDVDFLPSLALGVIIGVMKEAPGRVTLAVQKGSIARRVLEVSGLPHQVLRRTH